MIFHSAGLEQELGNILKSKKSAVSIARSNLNYYRGKSNNEQVEGKGVILDAIEFLLKKNPKMDMKKYCSMLQRIVIFPEITYLSIKYLKLVRE